MTVEGKRSLPAEADWWETTPERRRVSRRPARTSGFYDTPETHGRCPFETDLAARATRRMGALLAAGPFAFAPNPDGRDQDRYGRKLRIVVRHGRSLGDVLVAEGLARRWTGHREPWCV